jgi:hypothetical protein
VNHGQSGTRGQNCVLLGVFWTLNRGQSGPKWQTVRDQVSDRVQNLFSGVRFLIFDRRTVRQFSADSPTTPSFVLFGPFLARSVSVSSTVFCVGLLQFHRLYQGAFVTGWLGYPSFEPTSIHDNIHPCAISNRPKTVSRALVGKGYCFCLA